MIFIINRRTINTKKNKRYRIFKIYIYKQNIEIKHSSDSIIMFSMQANNNKKQKTNSKNKQKILCISPTQCSEKGLIKLSAV